MDPEASSWIVLPHPQFHAGQSQASKITELWTDLALALTSAVTLAADAALGVTVTACLIWHLAISCDGGKL